MWTRQMKFCYGFGACALLLGLYALFFMPAEDEVRNLGIFLFKLSPFCCAALSISLLDPKLVARFRLTVLFLFVCFGVYFFVYVPKVFFDVFFKEAEGLYYMTLVIVPFIILSLTLAFRLGGGGTGTSLRIAFGLLLLMISGLEDLAFLTINPHEPGKWSPIPEVWEWPSHMIVRLGHAPTKYEAYAFIAVHVGLALVVALHPFRFLARLRPFFGLEAEEGEKAAGRPSVT